MVIFRTIFSDVSSQKSKSYQHPAALLQEEAKGGQDYPPDEEGGKKSCGEWQVKDIESLGNSHESLGFSWF